ncbi:MAG: DNA polymerase III subunit delta, partial [Coleofasciculaceae cyanobacterium SM2_3_26]|nr:DNA polymerase III subunit delta [Coleofasciculaceae cyanobacterium SM2_3_26]
LTLWHELAGRNEPALRTVFSLVGYFRTWLGVKLMVESGEKDDRAIARNAGVSNPKRVYFLKQEVRGLSSRQLRQALGLLLDLEFDLKRGAEETSTMQAAVTCFMPCLPARRWRSPPAIAQITQML